MIKVGISAIGFNCSEFLQESLETWFKIKENPQEFGISELLISVTHSLFPEYHKLGFPLLSTDGTVESFKKFKEDGKFDFLHIGEEPLYEKDARNANLQFLLDKKIDLLWLLDFDEIYTEKDVKNILNFIRTNDLVSWFKVCFKNYINDTSHYVDDFVAPRIWKIKSCTGNYVKKFCYDNVIEYSNGFNQDILESNLIIPKNIAWVSHPSWVSKDKKKLKDKCRFQMDHYKTCSYLWDNEKNELILNKEYYQKIGKPIPQIHIDLEAMRLELQKNN